MSADLYVILGHRLSDPEIEELPALLNEYSRGQGGLFRLRFSHHLSGEIQEQDGKWVWQPDVDPEWALDEGVLVSEEHWEWAWKPDRDGDFGSGFRRTCSMEVCDSPVLYQEVFTLAHKAQCWHLLYDGENSLILSYRLICAVTPNF